MGKLCGSCGAKRISELALYCAQCGNPYTSSLDAEKPVTPLGAPGDSVLFPVSPRKFIVMSIVTLGCYPIYWFYKNWKWLRDKEGKKISPFWRTFFMAFFMYSLLKGISGVVKDRGVMSFYSAGWLTAGFIAVSAASILPDPYWIVSLLAFTCLLPAVNVVVLANPEGANNSFTGWNIAGIVLGSIMLLIVLIGVFLPAPRGI